jgi:hypothetical protein
MPSILPFSLTHIRNSFLVTRFGKSLLSLLFAAVEWMAIGSESRSKRQANVKRQRQPWYLLWHSFCCVLCYGNGR